MYHNTVIQQENAVMAVVGNVSTGYVRHVRRTRDYTRVISMQRADTSVWNSMLDS